MERRLKSNPRTLLAEFSARVGAETLNVRFYRARGSYVCERELVERDGTSFVMVVPFRKPETAQKVLVSDPYYPQIKLKAKRALALLEHAATSDDHPRRESH